MVFSSTVFLFAFLPVVLIGYYLCPGKMKNILLLVASLVFYAWGEPRYVMVMIVSITFNYICGRFIDRSNKEHKSSRLMLAFSVAGNLALLGYFKYTDFVIENINEAFGSSIGLIRIALPIGISFYTFQAMSYVIDVYRQKVGVQKNIIDFATYVTLFPQLIAGPIVRYITIEKQLKGRTHSVDQMADGIRRFILGLGKKILLANQVGLLWTEISGMDVETLPAVTAWIGAIAFTFQIYFDFSGYSDMAIGLGKIFGFDFDENFNYPYVSKSITEFWRRWHISLSTWFKEYVYIPLGGNKKGKGRQILNIFLVWGLTGLWHGANWNFILWGLYFGLILVLEKLFLLKYLEKLPPWAAHVYSLLLIVFGWILFAITDGSDLIGYIGAVFGTNGFFDQRTMYFLLTSGFLLLVAAIGSTGIPAKLGGKLMGRMEGNPTVYLLVKNMFYLAVLGLSVAFLVSDTYNPFLYFRF